MSGCERDHLGKIVGKAKSHRHAAPDQGANCNDDNAVELIAQDAHHGDEHGLPSLQTPGK